MKKVLQLPVCSRNRQTFSIVRVYTPSTIYMKSAVAEETFSGNIIGPFLEKGSDQPIVTLYYILSIYLSIHNQLIQTLFEVHIASGNFF